MTQLTAIGGLLSKLSQALCRIEDIEVFSPPFLIPSLFNGMPLLRQGVQVLHGGERGPGITGYLCPMPTLAY